MLVITIDLVPGGFQPRRRTIGTLRTANLSDLADIVSAFRPGLVQSRSRSGWLLRPPSSGARSARGRTHVAVPHHGQLGEVRMLMITIELVPGGFEPMRRSIATLRISNESNLADVSDYRVTAMEGANPLGSTPPRIAECTVVNHDRRQPVWALLEAAAAELRAADWVPL